MLEQDVVLDFCLEKLMNTRKEYIEQLKTRLDGWNADIGKMEEKLRGMKTDLRIDYEMALEDLRKKRDDANVKFKELQASGEEAWEDVRAGADVVWAAVREAYDKAASRFK